MNAMELIVEVRALIDGAGELIVELRALIDEFRGAHR